MLISFYLIWFTMVSMDFSKIWMVLYFLYNFVSDLYVLRLTWCSSKLGSDYQYFNISLLLHGWPINFWNDEWTSIFWMHERMHNTTYPKAWLDLHDSRFVLTSESLHLSWYLKFLLTISTKKTPYILIYAPLPPSPSEAKKKIFMPHLSISLSSLKKSQNFAAFFLLVGSMEQRGSKIWTPVYLLPCSMYLMYFLFLFCVSSA